MKTKNMKQEARRDHFKRAGLVQINAWVPSNEKGNILDQCAKLRRDYLRRISFDKFMVDEED